MSGRKLASRYMTVCRRKSRATAVNFSRPFRPASALFGRGSHSHDTSAHADNAPPSPPPTPVIHAFIQIGCASSGRSLLSPQPSLRSRRDAYPDLRSIRDQQSPRYPSHGTLRERRGVIGDLRALKIEQGAAPHGQRLRLCGGSPTVQELHAYLNKTLPRTPPSTGGKPVQEFTGASATDNYLDKPLPLTPNSGSSGEEQTSSQRSSASEPATARSLRGSTLTPSLSILNMESVFDASFSSRSTIASSINRAPHKSRSRRTGPVWVKRMAKRVLNWLKRGGPN